MYVRVGGYCQPRSHSIRLVAGVWCIGTFFLVNSYTSTLVSLITKPVQVPVINSIYDLPNKPNVYVAIEAGMGLNRIISNSQSGILKYLDDTLKNEPNIRCSTLTQCLEKVVDGTHVFAEALIMKFIFFILIVIFSI